MGDPAGSVISHACVSGLPSCTYNPVSQPTLLSPQGIKGNCENGNSDLPLTDAMTNVENENKKDKSNSPSEEHSSDEGEIAVGPNPTDEKATANELHALEVDTYKKYKENIICGKCGSKDHRNRGANGDKKQGIYRKISVLCKPCNSACRLEAALVASKLDDALREYEAKEQTLMKKALNLAPKPPKKKRLLQKSGKKDQPLFGRKRAASPSQDEDAGRRGQDDDAVKVVIDADWLGMVSGLQEKLQELAQKNTVMEDKLETLAKTLEETTKEKEDAINKLATLTTEKAQLLDELDLTMSTAAQDQDFYSDERERLMRELKFFTDQPPPSDAKVNSMGATELERELRKERARRSVVERKLEEALDRIEVVERLNFELQTNRGNGQEATPALIPTDSTTDMEVEMTAEPEEGVPEKQPSPEAKEFREKLQMATSVPPATRSLPLNQPVVVLKAKGKQVVRDQPIKSAKKTQPPRKEDPGPSPKEVISPKPAPSSRVESWASVTGRNCPPPDEAAKKAARLKAQTAKALRVKKHRKALEFEKIYFNIPYNVGLKKCRSAKETRDFLWGIVSRLKIRKSVVEVGCIGASVMELFVIDRDVSKVMVTLQEARLEPIRKYDLLTPPAWCPTLQMEERVILRLGWQFHFARLENLRECICRGLPDNIVEEIVKFANDPKVATENLKINRIPPQKKILLRPVTQQAATSTPTQC